MNKPGLLAALSAFFVAWAPVGASAQLAAPTARPTPTPVSVPAKQDPPLPTWKAEAESWGAWNELSFRDENGNGRSLWCHWRECGVNAKNGKAKLYTLKTIAYEPIKGEKYAQVTVMTSELTPYELAVNGKQTTVVRAGTALKASPYFQSHLTAQGSKIKVYPPTKMAGDACDEAKRKADDEARKKKEAEEARKKKQAEEARKKKEAEEARKKKEADEAKKKADEAKRKADETAKKKADEAKKAADEAAAKKAADEAAKKQADADAAKKAADEAAKKQADADAAKKAADEAAKKPGNAKDQLDQVAANPDKAGQNYDGNKQPKSPDAVVVGGGSQDAGKGSAAKPDPQPQKGKKVVVPPPPGEDKPVPAEAKPDDAHKKEDMINIAKHMVVWGIMGAVIGFALGPVGLGLALGLAFGIFYGMRTNDQAHA